MDFQRILWDFGKCLISNGCLGFVEIVDLTIRERRNEEIETSAMLRNSEIGDLRSSETFDYCVLDLISSNFQ